MSKADDRRREYARDLTPPERPNEPLLLPPPESPFRCDVAPIGIHKNWYDRVNHKLRCYYCGAVTEPACTREHMPMKSDLEIVLVDLSSVVYPIWHMSEGEPDTNHTAHQSVVKVRQLVAGRPYAAICCDLGKSFRKALDPTYKAQRPQQEAPLYHQMDRAKATLAADGFPVWAVSGFEADDLIATATAAALSMEGLSVLIASSDKDLLQLVGPRVRVMSIRDQVILDEPGVLAKFGVRPDQILDYLTLVGDASDNIKGVDNVGPKTAVALLARYGTLEALYAELEAKPATFRPKLAEALAAFAPSRDRVRGLITLRADVEPLAFGDILLERVPKVAAEFLDMDEGELAGGLPDFDPPPPAPAPAPSPAIPTPPSIAIAGAPGVAGDANVSVPNTGDSGQHLEAPAVVGEPIPPPAAIPATGPAATTAALVPRDPAVEAIRVTLPYERQLEPVNLAESIVLAKHMYNSNMFSAYGTPQGVLSTIMVGRELGFPAMASLRSIHNIEGRHALSAAAMVALVIKSGLAEYFEPVEFDELHAIFETKRRSGRNPVRLEHTIAMAKTAGLLKDGSNWIKIPIDMCVARAQSRLCRMIYPDLLAGLYTPEELEEIRELRTKAA